MPTYIILVNWTDQGLRNVRDTVTRAEALDELAEKHGGKNERLYWTVGLYDLVSIFEAPNDKSATAFTLEAASGGNVRTTTMRTYDQAEMSEIIEKLG